MRKICGVLMICAAVFVIIPLSAAAKKRTDGDGETNKEKDLFVLKADRKFVGAKVEIFYGDGEVVTTQVLQKKKMIIDFGDVKSGVYTIRLTKNGETKEFRYRK